MIEETPKHNVVTARFPNDAMQRLHQALSVLGCSRTELILAGTLAEIDRRMKNTKEAEAEKLSPFFNN